MKAPVRQRACFARRPLRFPGWMLAHGMDMKRGHRRLRKIEKAMSTQGTRAAIRASTYQLCVNFKMGLQLIFIWSRVVTAVSGTLQQDVTVFLNYMAFKAVFGDGRIMTLGAIIQMFPGVGADMHIKMHLVPKKFA